MYICIYIYMYMYIYVYVYIYIYIYMWLMLIADPRSIVAETITSLKHNPYSYKQNKYIQ